MVSILVFQGGDRDDVYAVGALVGGATRFCNIITRDFEFSTREISSFHYERFRIFITRDFDLAIKADFISVCHEKGDCIPVEWEMIGKYRRGYCNPRRRVCVNICPLCLYFCRTSFSI